MKILVTGAGGFVGKNLCAALNNIKCGFDRTRPNLHVDEIYTFDVCNTDEELSLYCKNADFVFNFAGVNRPNDASEFMTGNRDFAQKLLLLLKSHGNFCPVMLSSSIQATLSGRYAGSPYGQSKKAAEQVFFDYARSTKAKALVYRFPNLFGKWCRPGYNSAIATFCYNVARGLPITVNDESTVLDLVYIDDLVNEMLDALEGKENRNGEFCEVKECYSVSLGEIVSLLKSLNSERESLVMPECDACGFEAKLYSTFISYIPQESVSAPLLKHADYRGSFIELFKSERCGQLSVNVSLPGIVKGNHWHNHKWEKFIVVSGKGLIRQRKVGDDKVIENAVSGENPEAVYILPGYTHEIINLSKTENLVTLMWANERFNPDKPDTFFEKVVTEE